MYSRILVPLDGSQLSESSLPHLKSVNPGGDPPRIVLIVVAEPISSLAYTLYSGLDKEAILKIELQTQERAREYVEKVADRLEKQGMAVERVVAWGQPADEILNYAETHKVNLIVMSTHGRSGVSRWTFGSVADKVMRHSKIPVLIIPPGAVLSP